MIWMGEFRFVMIDSLLQEPILRKMTFFEQLIGGFKMAAGWLKWLPAVFRDGFLALQVAKMAAGRGIFTPLERIERVSMHSSRVKTHLPVKILHTAAIFTACIARNPSLNTVGSHFNHLVAILKLPISCWKNIVLRRIGSWSREPIIAKRNPPIQTIYLRSQKECR